MGKRGCKPKPLAIKRLHGSQRGDDEGYYKIPEPIGDGTIPSCPDWLSDPAKKKWFEVIQQLRRISESLLSSVDVQMLARYCVIWELWDKSRRFIEKNGEVMVFREADVVTKKGKKEIIKKGRVKYVQQLPQANLFFKYAQELRQIEDEFGMTPSARTKVGGESKKAGEEPNKARFFKFQGA